uniref:Myb_DNA-bind_5 domain-containing protein n=1 Tax=Rhabditophanes sp. KR3021 TaxID=114890 RepID=A0AC35TSF1_9BILA
MEGEHPFEDLNIQISSINTKNRRTCWSKIKNNVKSKYGVDAELEAKQILNVKAKSIFEWMNNGGPEHYSIAKDINGKKTIGVKNGAMESVLMLKKKKAADGETTTVTSVVEEVGTSVKKANPKPFQAFKVQNSIKGRKAYTTTDSQDVSDPSTKGAPS